MSTVCRPKIGYTDGMPDLSSVLEIQGDAKEMFIECEFLSPPSMLGRTVCLYVPREQVVGMLRAAKRAASAAREKPMGDSDAEIRTAGDRPTRGLSSRDGKRP